jgi:DNA-binding IclR family transcriptional regulator
VATPAFDRSGLACGTISISGPTARIDKADAAALSDLLRRHVAEVSAASGHRETLASVGSHAV